MLKNVEHTWGLAITYYHKHGRKDYGNKEFHLAIQQNDTTYRTFAQSWVEQRHIGKVRFFLPNKQILNLSFVFFVPLRSTLSLNQT